MSRMKANWPEQVNPTMELGSAKRWLMEDIKTIPKGCTKQPRDIYRVLSVVSAVAIIDNILETWER